MGGERGKGEGGRGGGTTRWKSGASQGTEGERREEEGGRLGWDALRGIWESGVREGGGKYWGGGEGGDLICENETYHTPRKLVYPRRPV